MIDQWNSIVTSNGNKLLKTSYLIDKWLTSQSMNAKDSLVSAIIHFTEVAASLIFSAYETCLASCRKQKLKIFSTGNK